MIACVCFYVSDMESLATCEKATAFICERGKLTTNWNTAKHFCKSLNCNHVSVFFLSILPGKFFQLVSVFLLIGCGNLPWCLLFVVFLDLQFNLHCNFQGLAFCQRNYLKISAFSINVQIKQVQQYEPLPKCRNMVHVHHTWRIHGALTILRLCSYLRIQQKLGYLVQCAFFCTSFRTTTIVRDREWSFAHVSLSWKLIFIWKKIFYKWQYLI